MILPTANAEETSTYSDYVVEGQSTYADSFGLMKGYDDGTFKPDNNMTRAEFYISINESGCNYQSRSTTRRNQFFPDIDKSYWAYDDIAKAVSIGFISGYDDGTFRPADNVTYEQAITMIFHVLGYKPVADLYGGYPHAYMSLGYYNRFFKSSTDNRNGNIEMNETKEKTAITRRDAMDMLGGMLFTPICVVTDYKTAFDGSNEPIYEIGGNGTVKQTLFTIKMLSSSKIANIPI